MAGTTTTGMDVQWLEAEIAAVKADMEPGDDVYLAGLEAELAEAKAAGRWQKVEEVERRVLDGIAQRAHTFGGSEVAVHESGAWLWLTFGGYRVKVEVTAAR
jgi:hypothetical protein